MRFVIFSALVLSVAALSGCGKTRAFHDCVERGIASHKEMGSYPKMKTPAFAGKDAQEIIESRCSRSTVAY